MNLAREWLPADQSSGGKVYPSRQNLQLLIAYTPNAHLGCPVSLISMWLEVGGSHRREPTQTHMVHTVSTKPALWNTQNKHLTFNHIAIFTIHVAVIIVGQIVIINI